jgi:hypothetical protein
VDRNTIINASSYELFGDALESRRSLRRAYALLIRKYGPEKDPVCFRHIRNAYEALCSHFDAPEIEPTPLGVETDHNFSRRHIRGVRPAVEHTFETCRTLLNEKRAHEALQLLNENETDLRAQEPALWFELMVNAILGAGYAVSPERIERAFDDLDNPEFDLDEKTYVEIATHWVTVQAWDTARDDENLPAVFRQALVAPRPASRLILAQRWRNVLVELGDSAFAKAYSHLVQMHPGLVPVLHEIDNEITGVGAFMHTWEFNSPKVQVATLDLAEIRSLRKLKSNIRKPKFISVVAQRMLAIFAVLTALLPWSTLPKGWGSNISAMIILILAGIWLFRPINYLRSRDMRRAKALEQRVRQLVASSEMFRYEIIASIIGQRDSKHVAVGQGFFSTDMLDPLTNVAEQPPLELALLTDTHLLRIEREMHAVSKVCS